MSESLPPDTEVAGYRLHRVLGRGGMGVVYVAEHVHLQKLVALKTLSGVQAQDPQFRDRFVRESRLAAQLDHDHIVPIHDAGEAGGLLYLAMRLVEGEDLDAVIHRDAPLQAADVVEVLAQVASALDVAHTEGLVHRDVKPANILLERRRRDGGWHAYLADFGLTKYAAADSGPTPSGQVLGTPFYVAPEQIQGNVVNGRADQYSLACVLFECLTGRRPFDPGGELLAIIAAHAQAPRPQVTTQRPDLPGELDAVLAAGLAVDPDQRYASCSDLIAAAEEALHPGEPDSTAAPPTSDTPPVPAEPTPGEPAGMATDRPHEPDQPTAGSEADPTAAPSSDTPPPPSDAPAPNAAEAQPAETPAHTARQPHQPPAGEQRWQQPPATPGVKPPPSQPPHTRQRPATRERPGRRWWTRTAIGLAAVTAIVLVAGAVAGMSWLASLPDDQQPSANADQPNSDQQLPDDSENATPTPTPTPTPTATATADPELSEPPDGFVEFRDKEAGFRIFHPENWTRQSPDDPEMRFLATPNARDSILVRVTPVDLDELEGDASADDFRALHGFAEEIVRGEDVEILDDGSVEIASTVASHYLYTFDTAEGEERGAKSHFFIFEEGRMITLVLQTIPPQRYSELAGTFEVVVRSFELLD